VASLGLGVLLSPGRGKRMNLRDVLGVSAPIKVIEYAFENSDLDFTKRDVMHHKDVSLPTLNKYWDTLIEAGVIENTRMIGNAQLVRLTNKPIVKQLRLLLLTLK
jgi:hypothetical protein